MSRRFWPVLAVALAACDGAPQIGASSEAIIDPTRFGWHNYITSTGQPVWNATGAVDVTAHAGTTGMWKFRFHGAGAMWLSTVWVGSLTEGQRAITPVYCKHHHSAQVGSDYDLYVRCFNSGGKPTDSALPQVSWVAPSQPAQIGLFQSHAPDGSVFSYNWTGGLTDFSTTGTGRYMVKFEGMGNLLANNAQVVATGNSSSRCQLANFFTLLGDAYAFVACTNWAGTAQDSDFNLIYTTNDTMHDGAGGMLTNTDLSPGTHTPGSAVSYNSTGGANSIVMDDGTTDASIYFGGLDTGTSSMTSVMQSTTLGTAGEYCTTGIGYDHYDLNCFDGTGQLARVAVSTTHLWYPR
jgi:hypothetical protein